MRILICGGKHPNRIGGGTVGIHGLALALRDRGHDVTLLHAARREHRHAVPGIRSLYVDVTQKSLYPLLLALRPLGSYDVIHACDDGAAFFALRARLLTPLAASGVRYESDALLEVGPDGTITRVEAWTDPSPELPLIDLRPMVLMPGLVDLHVHLPQVPAAGLGAGMDLLAWLERHVFARERVFRASVAEVQVPLVLSAMAAAGTTSIQLKFQFAVCANTPRLYVPAFSVTVRLTVVQFCQPPVLGMAKLPS